MNEELGQIWTPLWMVQKMLDQIGLTPDFFASQLSDTNEAQEPLAILEPSFGAGVFLGEIIQRIMTAGEQAEISNQVVSSFIDESLYAVELDSVMFANTIANLRTEFPNLSLSLPHVVQGDFTSYAQEHELPDGGFTHIVGNPPYVRVHHLSERTRERLRELSTTTGMMDLYVAFYELGIDLLRTDGRLIFVAPNSWQKNVSQKPFRNHLVSQRLLVSVQDYGMHQVFPDASTYVSIAEISKTPQKSFSLVNMKLVSSEISMQEGGKSVLQVVSDTVVSEHEIPYAKITAPEVMLSQHVSTVAMEAGSVLLGDICDVQNGVETLLNKAFVLGSIEGLSDASLALVRPAAKGSKYKGEPHKWIIFPYSEEPDGTFTQISETEFAQATELYDHLMTYQANLLKRKADKKAEWFHYGRSQAIKKTSARKGIFSSILSPDKPLQVFVFEDDFVVYSGLFVTEKTVDGAVVANLAEVQRVMQSEELAAHIRFHGKNMRGGYTNLSAPIVKSFVIPPHLLPESMREFHSDVKNPV